MANVMCHMSHVRCHVSGVRCEVSQFFQSGEAIPWMICYQQGLPSLVLLYINLFALTYHISLVNFFIVILTVFPKMKCSQGVFFVGDYFPGSSLLCYFISTLVHARYKTVFFGE